MVSVIFAVAITLCLTSPGPTAPPVSGRGSTSMDVVAILDIVCVMLLSSTYCSALSSVLQLFSSSDLNKRMAIPACVMFV